MKRCLLAVGGLSAWVGLATRAVAEDATAPLGSPAATRTISGDVLPPLPQTMEHTIPLILQWDENLDVGADTLTGVDDQDYQRLFAFNGTIDKLTIKIERPQLSPDDIRKLRATTPGASNKSSEQNT